MDASTPLLLFDPEVVTHKYELLHSDTHGNGSDVVILWSLSFSIGDEDSSDEDEIDEGYRRIFDVNEEDLQGNSPLFLTCNSGNLKIVEILVSTGADVSATNERGDTPLLVSVGVGRFDMFEWSARD